MDASRNATQQAVTEAEGYLELGMINHALATLDRLGKTEGLGSRAVQIKGEALRMAGRHEEAVIVLKRAVDLDPKIFSVWLALGWCYKRIGRIEMAIQSLDMALEIEPRNALIHYNLACYWSLNGNAQKALQSLTIAIDIDSHYREFIDSESDLDPIRWDPQFVAMTNAIV